MTEDENTRISDGQFSYRRFRTQLFSWEMKDVLFVYLPDIYFLLALNSEITSPEGMADTDQPFLRSCSEDQLFPSQIQEAVL